MKSDGIIVHGLVVDFVVITFWISFDQMRILFRTSVTFDSLTEGGVFVVGGKFINRTNWCDIGIAPR